MGLVECAHGVISLLYALKLRAEMVVICLCIFLDCGGSKGRGNTIGIGLNS